MNFALDDEQKAIGALKYIMPILERLHLRWCITGGFACYVYGVERPLTDIDIDVEGSKDANAFLTLLTEVMSQITQPLKHFIDQNYDNYNFEITINGQVVDICPMVEMKVFDKLRFPPLAQEDISRKGKIEAAPFYSGGFPQIEVIDFKGIRLPLLAKDLIIKNKEMLVWKRESDIRDVAGLQRLT